MFINYAHRGASAYAPENTMSAFRLGIALGANGIETDIRKTKDGVPVLFHDESLLRLTGIDRKIADVTFEELAGLRIPSPDGTAFDTVPTLAEFLRFASEHPVALALEIKTGGLEAEVKHAIDANGLADRCVVTSFHLGCLGGVKALDPAQAVGLLTYEVSGEQLRGMKEIGGEQICPKAAFLTPALARSLHEEGFSVRPWGIRDETAMERAFRCGVDGMTVNFPDKLLALLREQQEYKERNT